MTIKRLILIVLTLVAVVKISLSLIESWGQPQIQSRLELYQTNLLLHASEWQPNAEPATPAASNPDLTSARNTLIGTNPLKTAQNQYQEARESAQEAQSKIVAKLQKLSTNEAAVATDAAKPQIQVAPVADTPRSSQQRQQWEMSLSQVEQ